MKKGFSLLEVIISCVIIGILAAFAVPQFVKTKERSLDKEAIGYLNALKAAERMYYTEKTKYYPDSGSESNVTNINTNLQVNLPTANLTWNYQVSSTGDVQGTRNKTGGRRWTFTIGGDSPTCTAGASDPCL